MTGLNHVLPGLRFPCRAALALLLGVASARGQEIILPRPLMMASEWQSDQPAFEPDVMVLEQSPSVEVQADAPLPEAAPSDAVQSGGAGYSSVPRRFHYNFELQVREVYDDNVDLDNLQRRSDFYTSIEPKIILGLGDIENRDENFLRLVYSPTVLFFAEHGENNAFEQAIQLDGQYRLQRLQIQLSQDIQFIDSSEIGYRTNLDETNSQVNLDVSGRVRLDTFTTRLAGSYDLSSKTFLSGGITNAISAYRTAGLLDSQTTAGNIFVNYRYSPKLTVGLGAGAGFEFVDPPTPDQTFEQANVRLVYELRKKLVLNASVGLEFRQFEGASRDQYLSPVVELGTLYRPFPGTEIRVNGRRRTQSSATLAGQDYSSTSLDIAGRQRLFRRFVVGLAAGYQNAEYFAVLSDEEEGRRSDNYYYFAPSVDVLVTRYSAVGLYYLRRQNETSGGSFGFNDNQIGFRGTIVF